MGNDTRDAVGVDISKAHLDVHRLNTGEAARFGNDAAGFERWRRGSARPRTRWCTSRRDLGTGHSKKRWWSGCR